MRRSWHLRPSRLDMSIHSQVKPTNTTCLGPVHVRCPVADRLPRTGASVPLYAEERQHAIADLVTRDRRVSVSEAAEVFGVTTETVRRDLAVLERQGLIHRVHGGAVPAHS